MIKHGVSLVYYKSGLSPQMLWPHISHCVAPGEL